MKLGGVGILYWEDHKIQEHKVGGRSTGAGAKWGTILGVATGILSGGVTLIGGAIAGAAGGAVLGSFHHMNLGLTDEDMARLEKKLEGGQAALVVMADEDEVAVTAAELKSLGGEVESYEIPEETMANAEEAEEVKPIEQD